MHILIDTDGMIWDECSGTLRTHFHAPISSRALPDYLVRNMGFIGLKIDRETAVIRGAPSLISYAAFSVAVGLIEDASIRRTALIWFDGCWHDETFFGQDIGQAKKRLLALMLNQRRAPSKHYLSNMRDLKTIAKDDHHGPLLDYWRDRRGRIDPTTCIEKLYDLTNGKFLAVKHCENGKIVFSAIGKGLTVYQDNSWAVQFSGGPVEEQPDYNYGQWVANGYREAFVHQRPSLSDVKAVVHDARNGNSQHISYARLLLPIETDTGEIQLLSAPRADATIDLSIEAAEEMS